MFANASNSEKATHPPSARLFGFFHQSKQAILPEIPNSEKLLEKHADSLPRVSDEELRRVLDRRFHEIQTTLRARSAYTDAVVAELGGQLVREHAHQLTREDEQIQQSLRDQHHHDQENSRKLQIARELTEARIKARQALHQRDDDDDESPRPGVSPTSVTSYLDVNVGLFQKHTQSTDDEDDDDESDIQEILVEE